MDERTYIRLSEDMMPAMHRMACSILRSQADAQDAVQQALLNAWKARENARSGAERAWLMRITLNECRNLQRDRLRQSRLAAMVQPEQAAWKPPNLALREAVDALPSRLRTPFLLKYMEGMSERETAEALALRYPA